MKTGARAVRVRSDLKVSFREVAGDFPSGSTGKNISENGLCIPLTHLPTGTLLEVVIRSAEFKKPFKATARVAWITNRNDVNYPYEAGLEFLDLGPAERKILRTFIEQDSWIA